MGDITREIIIQPYKLISEVFGSSDIIRLRQKLYSTCEIFFELEGFQHIPSGSRAEGLELDSSDFDVMRLQKYGRVYETVNGIDLNDKTFSIVMETEDCKLGFTKLRVLDVGEISKRADFLTQYLMNLWIIKDGVSYYLSSGLVRRELLPENVDVHGPCQQINIGILEMECLHCFRCKEWISVAQPWVSRKREDWPTNELIKDIAAYGVLFVPVGCKTSRYEDIEWRISFSIAEKQLIHAFTHTQLLCYAMLKTVVSDISKQSDSELLCSYFVKTIMLWLADEHGSQFWIESQITSCYMTCLERLIYCVQCGICPHFFIPDINLFEQKLRTRGIVENVIRCVLYSPDGTS